MIGICTDSNAQLPPSLVDRYAIEVVPITVTIDGIEYAEGVDLDADAFYARFAGGATPQVSTAQPSPGRFAEAYRRLVDRGASEIISIHVSATVSGTLNSARLAAGEAPVNVHLVDSGTASFGVGCCVWEAAEALVDGATVRESIEVAQTLARTIGNVFVVGALDLVRQGGRLDPTRSPSTDTVPVLSLVEGKVTVIATASDLVAATAVMASYVRAWGTGLKVAIGVADREGAPLSDALEAALTNAVEVHEVLRYRIGPSVGVHTGPGTAGAFFFPTVD
ncbi:MAG: DegV family protein [Acidimicrobiales bacterium]